VAHSVLKLTEIADTPGLRTLRRQQQRTDRSFKFSGRICFARRSRLPASANTALPLQSFAPVRGAVATAHDDSPLQQRSAHGIPTEPEFHPISGNSQPAAYSRSATSTCVGLSPRGLGTAAPWECNRFVIPVRLTLYRSANSAAVAPASNSRRTSHPRCRAARSLPRRATSGSVAPRDLSGGQKPATNTRQRLHDGPVGSGVDRAVLPCQPEGIRVTPSHPVAVDFIQMSRVQIPPPLQS
jgi:hypothetical protein